MRTSKRNIRPHSPTTKLKILGMFAEGQGSSLNFHLVSWFNLTLAIIQFPQAKLYKEYTGNVGFAPCYFADALTESRNVNELVKHLFVSINAMSNAGYEVPDSYR